MALQSKDNKWYAMTNYVSDRLFVTDPLGEKSEMMNNEFKYGIVFYNPNCKSNTTNKGNSDEENKGDTLPITQ